MKHSLHYFRDIVKMISPKMAIKKSLFQLKSTGTFFLTLFNVK